MTVEEKIAAVQKWQSCPYVHPLTCFEDSNHRELVPNKYDLDRDIVLECPDCGYTQYWCPKGVFSLNWTPI